MLKLKSVDRTKRRYMLINSVNKKEIENCILDYIGILGYAKAKPEFIDNDKNYLILAIERSSVNEIRAAFEISKKNIDIVKVSGTLKGLGLDISL